MSFFDQVYHKVFGKKTNPHKAILHETLSRSERFQSDYQQWLMSGQAQKLMDDIRNSFELKKKGIAYDQPAVHILNSAYANGIAVSFSDHFQQNDFAYLLDHLSSMILTIGYKKANNDILISEKGNYTETVEKCYLKPIISVETPIDQKYGNILIEHVKINDKPSYLKFSANIYSDRLYKDAKPFNDLMNFIFYENAAQ
jgi:hypothetical protein